MLGATHIHAIDHNLGDLAQGIASGEFSHKVTVIPRRVEEIVPAYAGFFDGVALLNLPLTWMEIGVRSTYELLKPSGTVLATFTRLDEFFPARSKFRDQFRNVESEPLLNYDGGGPHKYVLFGEK